MLIYTAMSKHFFFCRDAVCEYVLRSGAVPLNPFRLFDYFLGDRVDRSLIRAANRELVTRADETWVFGPLADGVIEEIALAEDFPLPVRYHTIGTRADEIAPCDVADLPVEQEVLDATGMTAAMIGQEIAAGRAHMLVTVMRHPGAMVTFR